MISCVVPAWVLQLEKEQRRFQNHRFAEVLPGYVTQTFLVRRTLRLRSRRVGDPVDWILRAGEQGAVIELLSDLLVYERTHENHLRRRENVSGSPPPVRQNIHG
jgi:hypothetical protein